MDLGHSHYLNSIRVLRVLDDGLMDPWPYDVVVYWAHQRESIPALESMSNCDPICLLASEVNAQMNIESLGPYVSQV